MIVDDRRRECLRRNAPLSRRVKRAAERVLRHTVCIEDVIVIQLIPDAVSIRMGIRHARDIIGNLACLSDVLGAVCSRSILERPRAARQSKCDMSLIARDDADISTCRRIRRKIDAPSRRIGCISVIDLLRCDLCIRRTVINFETVARDLALDNLAIEIDRVSDHLIPISHSRDGWQVEIIVPRIRAAQSNVLILQLMVADMNLLSPCRIRVRRVSNLRQVNVIGVVAVVQHDFPLMVCGRSHCGGRRIVVLVQRDVRRRCPCLLHRVVEHRIRAVVDLSVSPSLIDF